MPMSFSLTKAAALRALSGDMSPLSALEALLEDLLLRLSFTSLELVSKVFFDVVGGVLEEFFDFGGIAFFRTATIGLLDTGCFVKGNDLPGAIKPGIWGCVEGGDGEDTLVGMEKSGDFVGDGEVIFQLPKEFVVIVAEAP